MVDRLLDIHIPLGYVDKKDDDTQIHLRNDEMMINDKVAVFIEQLHHDKNNNLNTIRTNMNHNEQNKNTPKNTVKSRFTT